MQLQLYGLEQMHKSDERVRLRTELSKSVIGTAVPSYGSLVDSTAKKPNSAEMFGHSGGRSSRLITASNVILPPVPWYRKIRIPGLIAGHSPHSNAIRTTKYTIFNFVFKNLWEQFHRWANLYFLFIVLLNYIPQVEAVGKEVAYMPLLFVLVTIAGKDIFEDYRRFKSDREVNHRLCRVYDK